MDDLERILLAYERGLRQLNDDLMAQLDPSPEERDHLALLGHLLEGLLQSYGSYNLRRAKALDASTSVMYAANTADADNEQPRVLDVPLRSLVDSNTLTTWQARYLHGCLSMKRVIIVTGLRTSGKSTLLNSLIQLIPVDQRIIAIEQAAELPVLKSRSFTVHLTAKPGTPASATALLKAAGMKPTWILAGALHHDDGPAFFGALGSGTTGIATLETPDPEVTLMDWTATSPPTLEHLRRLAPLMVHMGRDAGGKPRVLKLLEVSVDPSGLRLTERREA